MILENPNKANFSRLVDNDDNSKFLSGHISAKTMNFQTEKSFCESVQNVKNQIY